MKELITIAILFHFCIQAGYCNHFEKDTIKIGLLVQDKNSKAALRGAQLAVKKANARANNKYFVLAVRDMEGPWGTGSRVTVDLVFNEKVWAIIGSVDGRNSHLAEQVSAKTRIPFLSAWSGDPSLAYAFIPWYYCCVPNDRQKAQAIAEQIKSGDVRTAIITAKDYDSKTSAESFLKTAKELIPDPFVFHFDGNGAFDSIAKAIKRAGTRNIVFFGPASEFREFRKYIPAGTYRLFLSSYADGESTIKTVNLEGVNLISPGYLFSSSGKKFTDEFRKIYGIQPGDAAAYAYDMTNIVISSIMASANDRDSLKTYLRKTDFEGITGRIGFDDRGSRKGKIELITVKNGEFVKEE